MILTRVFASYLGVFPHDAQRRGFFAVHSGDAAGMTLRIQLEIVDQAQIGVEHKSGPEKLGFINGSDVCKVSGLFTVLRDIR